jgi:aminopeptidase N
MKAFSSMWVRGTRTSFNARKTAYLHIYIFTYSYIYIFTYLYAYISYAQVLAEARRRYDEHWADPSALPSDYKSTVYKIVLKNGGKAEYDAIKAIFYASEDNALKKTAFAIGATPSKELKLATLDWAVKSGDVKLQDFFYPIAPVASSSEGADLAWGYYKENFDLIKEKLSKASPSLMDAAIVYSTNKFCTNEKAKEMEDFFASHPLPQSARRISQSIEMIRSAGKLFAIVQKSKLASASFWA